MQLAGNVLDRGFPAAPPHERGESLGVERVVGQEIDSLALHPAETPAVHAAHFELEVDPRIGAGQIAHAAPLAVVPVPMRQPTDATRRFFERRTRVMTRAFGSPKTPFTTSSGRNPGKRYVSNNRFRLREAGMRNAPRFCHRDQTRHTPRFQAFRSCSALRFTHTIPRRAFFHYAPADDSAGLYWIARPGRNCMSTPVGRRLRYARRHRVAMEMAGYF